MYRTQGFIFRRWLYIQLWYGTFYMHQYKHSSTYLTAYTDACKMYHIITVYTAVFLKMNPWVRNMQKPSRNKNSNLWNVHFVVYVVQLYYNAHCKKHKIKINLLNNMHDSSNKIFISFIRSNLLCQLALYYINQFPCKSIFFLVL
jgi:hypothetical protein